MVEPLRQLLATVNHRIGLWARNLAAGLLAAMLLMILAQVLFRYLLNDSLAWTEEMAKYAMVWVACLVAPWSYRNHLNVNIGMFAESLPPLVQRLLQLTITVLILLVSGYFLAESLAFVDSAWRIQASSVPVPLAYFYACAPFAFAAIMLVGLEQLLDQFVDAKHSEAG